MTIEAAKQEVQRHLWIIQQVPEEWWAYVKQRYEQGELRALGETIHHCALLGWPLPPWAAEAFAINYQKLKSGRFKSWDDVLGRVHPKGRHMKSAMIDSRAFSIHFRCRELIEQKNGKEKFKADEALFDKVGKEFKMKKTKCQELYLQCESWAKKFREAEAQGLIPPAKS